RPRSAALIRGQGPSSNALRAAWTARSMSALSPSATSQSTSPVAGVSVEKVLPDALPVHCPPLNIGWGFCPRCPGPQLGPPSAAGRLPPRCPFGSIAFDIVPLQHRVRELMLTGYQVCHRPATLGSPRSRLRARPGSSCPPRVVRSAVESRVPPAPDSCLLGPF